MKIKIIMKEEKRNKNGGKTLNRTSSRALNIRFANDAV
jgi:hypothetical protein